MQRLLPLHLLIIVAMAALDACFAQSSGNIVVGGSDRCVGLPNSNFANGAQPTTLKCVSKKPSQTWHFAAARVSGKTVLRTSNGACLDVPNGRGANGAKLQVWACNMSSTNQFFARDGNNIRWNGSKYCLDVAEGAAKGFASHLSIQLWDCNLTSSNQKFLGPSSTVIKAVTTAKTTARTTARTTAKTTSTTAKTTSTTVKTTSPAPTTSSTSSTRSSTSTTTTSTTSSSSASSPVVTVTKPALTSVFSPTAKRMLPWGYNDQFAALMGIGSKISTYHHWELNVVKQMPSRVRFLPTYWGITQNASWNAVQATIGSTVPPAVLGFNEPDISSQANMSPSVAAETFYRNITLPYGTKGSLMVSPAIAWNVNGWLKPFLTQCAQLGCGIDAIGMHFYVDINNNTDAAVSYIRTTVESVYARFGLPLVLGEVGLTQKGGGTDEQIADFVQKVGNYLDNSGAVLAWGLSAVFAKGAGWDGYLNSNMAFFWPNNTLTDLATMYMYNTF